MLGGGSGISFGLLFLLTKLFRSSGADLLRANPHDEVVGRRRVSNGTGRSSPSFRRQLRCPLASPSQARTSLSSPPSSLHSALFLTCMAAVLPRDRKALDHLSSGAASGLASSVLLQPLDLLKTRIQQQGGTSK